MSALLFLLILDLALAILLIVLAAGVWYTSIRTPPTIP